ncbi:hypothetical protein JCM3770_000630 [Rhodotorula araucariae]
MACTCHSALSALRQPARRIARPALARLFSSSPSPLAPAPPAHAKAASPSALPPSACPAGTVLKGLNYLKDGQDPVALEDSEYPPWVWTLAGERPAPKKAGQDDGAAFLRKQRADLKKQAKAGIKAANDLKG